jgi:hypothetical protein
MGLSPLSDQKYIVISHHSSITDLATVLNFVVMEKGTQGALGKERYSLRVNSDPLDGNLSVYTSRGNKTHHITKDGRNFKLEEAREIWTVLVRQGAEVVDNPLVLGAKMLKTRKPSGAVTVAVDFETAVFNPWIPWPRTQNKNNPLTGSGPVVY